MQNTIDRQGIAMIGGLVIEYLLGMIVSLYVRLPEDVHTGWRFAMHNALIALHLLIGTLLLVNAIGIVVQVRRAIYANWRLWAWSGLISVLLAWAAGDGFISTQLSGLSLLMAIMSLVAVLCYGAGLYMNRPIAVGTAPK